MFLDEGDNATAVRANSPDRARINAPSRAEQPLLRRQYPRQLAQRLAMPFVRDLREVAGEFQAHPLPHRQVALAPLSFQTLEEVADRHPQYPRNLKQPASRDAIDSALVLMSLL